MFALASAGDFASSARAGELIANRPPIRVRAVDKPRGRKRSRIFGIPFLRNSLRVKGKLKAGVGSIGASYSLMAQVALHRIRSSERRIAGEGGSIPLS